MATQRDAIVVHTPGPWVAYRLVHEDTNEPMTPDQIGEYVRNSVIKSAKESGSHDFLFISAEKPDGPADVCHVGNGPTSPANAAFIVRACNVHDELLAALRKAVDTIRAFHAIGLGDEGIADHVWELYQQSPEMQQINAAIAKAEGRP